MTALTDADLQRLLDRLVSDATKAGADYLSPKRNEQCEVSYNAFCAALNERLKAAERLEKGLLGASGAFEALKIIGADRALPGFAHTLQAAETALAAYRQSKERG